MDKGQDKGQDTGVGYPYQDGYPPQQQPPYGYPLQGAYAPNQYYQQPPPQYNQPQYIPSYYQQSPPQIRSGGFLKGLYAYQTFLEFSHFWSFAAIFIGFGVEFISRSSLCPN